jgi:hypothetical protein
MSVSDRSWARPAEFVGNVMKWQCEPVGYWGGSRRAESLFIPSQFRLVAADCRSVAACWGKQDQKGVSGLGLVRGRAPRMIAFTSWCDCPVRILRLGVLPHRVDGLEPCPRFFVTACRHSCGTVQKCWKACGLKIVRLDHHAEPCRRAVA